MNITNLKSTLAPLFCGLLMRTAVVLTLTGVLVADDGPIKRPLDHSDYDRWNTISGPTLSPDGDWVRYSIISGKVDGDTTVIVRNISSGKQFSILRGKGPQFSFDNRFAIYRIDPDPEIVKKLKKEKAKPEQMPSAHLEILELKTGDQFIAPRVTSFALPEKNGRWLAYQVEKPVESASAKAGTAATGETYEVTSQGLRLPEKKLKLKKREALQTETAPQKETTSEKEPKTESAHSPSKQTTATGDDDQKKKKDKPTGSTLVLRDLETGIERRFPDVVDYQFSKHGSALAFATSVEPAETRPAKTPAAESSAGKPENEKNRKPESESLVDA